jgi:hypothetical protein
MLDLNYAHNLCHRNLQISYLSLFYEADKITFYFRKTEAINQIEINQNKIGLKMFSIYQISPKSV